MPYPKIILTSRVRKGINIFLILSFFIISPLLLLYTAGYRYDFQNKIIKQTGVISIDVMPTNALVFLNGIQINKKIPIRLTNRAPGIYTVKIELPQYHSWEKDITVESKQTTFIKNLSLYKKSTPEKAYSPAEAEKIIDVFPSFDSSFIILISQKDDNDVYEIKLRKSSTGEVSDIMRLSSDFAPVVSWSKFDNFVYLKNQNEKNTTITIFDAENLENIKSFSFPIENLDEKIQWSFTTSPNLFIKENYNIKQIGISNEKIIQKNVLDKLWFVDQENKLWIFDAQNNILKTTNEKHNLELPISQPINEIIDINNNRAILADEQSIIVRGLDATKDNSKILKAQQTIYNYQTKEWLVWSTLEIWSIYPDGSLALLNRIGKEIEKVYPLDGFGVILLATPRALTAFNPGYYTSTELFGGIEKIQKIAVDQRNKNIFFFGQNNGEQNLYLLKF